VVVSVVADSNDFNLTHYYVFKDGVSAIAVATDINSEPSVGELRDIFRLDNLTQSYKEGKVSDIGDGEAIEAEDVYLVDGETGSKVCNLFGFPKARSYESRV
jgi:rhamnogalacturonan endolyase